MEFTLTKPQKEIQKAIFEFCKGEFDKEFGLDCERNRTYPNKLLEKACDLGFIGIHYPEEYLGAGLGLFEHCLVAETLCRRDSTLGLALTLTASGAEFILRSGTGDQKDRYLQQIAEGRLFSAAALVDEGLGYDFRCLKTTAAQENGQWVIDGKKSLVLNGGTAGIYVVLCRTGTETEPQEKNLTLFLVEKEAKGLTCEDAGTRISCNMLTAADLTFNQVCVPDTSRIGDVGDGYRLLNRFLDECRVVLSAQAVGIALGAYDRALAYCRERVQFGKSIGQFQITAHKLADMARQIEYARALSQKAAWHFDNGMLDPGLAAMAKLTAAQGAVAVAYEAIQLHGGYGFMTEYEVEHFYRDAKFTELFCGAGNVQRDVIAASVYNKKRS
ncbi:MAG: acyl-CoA dehydrogenase family protein [Thermodesulfobacteriota bacterium]|nr:acyl-CoA dehydrogenase family protein [Thermodesulfobacteriota bacterium]